MSDVSLTPEEHGLLAGDAGEAARLAMRILLAMAEVMGARRLLPVTRAHVDGCLYHGRAGLDFAELLVKLQGRVVVPTTLNVGSLDLLHPELFRGERETASKARRLMDCYVALGCEPTWTCAPYLLPQRPSFGEQIAWAESNAIVFANSVLGARTNRYGDFLDICAALLGRVPDAGLHQTENRRGEIVFDVGGIPPHLLREDVFYPVLGHLVGQQAGTLIPVLDGLPSDVHEDQLKALGAAAASSGSVALFHAVGVTPEAPSLRDALQGNEPRRRVEVNAEHVRIARDSLTTAREGSLSSVCLGTPHFSLAEFERLVPMLEGFRLHPNVDFYVSTSRHVLQEVDARGWQEVLEGAGVQLVTDTCTYVTAIVDARGGVVMTNSAKWAYYAPGNLGVEVAFGSLSECVRSAEKGVIWRDSELWAGL